jgi:tetratricopeptide (TPR) repeat protein
LSWETYNSLGRKCLLNPLVNAYINRGNAKSNLGDKQGAIADYQKAAELYQKEGNTKAYQDTLEKLKKLQ